MREIIIKIPFYYECQACFRVFLSNLEHRIEIGLLPVCSNRCAKVFYYKIFSSYSMEQLTYLVKALSTQDFSALNQQNLILKLVEICPKLDYPLLNEQAQGSGSTNHTLSIEHKTGSGSTNPYVIGIEPDLVAEPKVALWIGGRFK